MHGLVVAEWAKAYTKAGWVVLPARNKRPLVPWREWQNKRPSLEQVNYWFDGCPDDCQIALVTGRMSGVTVIDIDTHKEGCQAKSSGACDCNPKSVEQLREEVGFYMTSKTGSGGAHVFFRYNKNIGNSVGLASPQLDVRSEGGIIILPPSIHGSGDQYEWWDMYPWMPENLQALQEFPQKYMTQLIQKPKTDWHQIVDGVGKGNRNNMGAALAGKLVSAFGKEYLDVSWDLLKLWNEHRCTPPQSEAALRATFKSIVTKHYGS